MSKEQDRTAELLQKIEDGTKAVFQSEEYWKYLKTMSNFHHYSFRNSLLIYLQNPDASLVAGYNAWQKVNRNVMRGEKGIEIVAYTPKTIWVNERVLDDHGKPVLDEHGKQVYEKRREKIPAYKPVYVFDVSQTRGEPLPDFGPRTLEADVENLDTIMAALRQISPLPIHQEPIEDSDTRGFCSFGQQKIVVREGMPPAQTLKTAVHEIAHAIMHDPASEDRPDRHTREVEAESVAFLVCDKLGLDTSDYTFPYLAGWSGSQELEQLHASLDRIQHVANVLIQQFDAKMLELQREAPVQDRVESRTEESRLISFDQNDIGFFATAIIDGREHRGMVRQQGDMLYISFSEMGVRQRYEFTAEETAKYRAFEASRIKTARLDEIETPAKDQHPAAPAASPSRAPENTVSGAKKPRPEQYTSDQIDRAASTDLESWLESQGEKLLKSGREQRLDRDRSVTVRGNQWYDHSRQQGGNAITFVQRYYNLSFPEAVKRLLDGEPATYSPADKPEAPVKLFEAPERNADMRRVFAYLTITREIDPEVVRAFAKAGTLYEDTKRHNAIFLGRDEDGVSRHAHARSTNTEGQSFKLNLEGSDARYSFHHIGSSPELYVYEAPIDMLSYISLHPDNWQQHSYVACCGLSTKAVHQVLNTHPEIRSVHLCLDNDEAGRGAVERMTGELSPIGYTVRPEHSVYTDWNEDLIATRFYEAQKSTPPATMEAQKAEIQRREKETLDTVRFDGEIDLDKERSRENLGFRDKAPPPTTQKRPSLMERMAAAEKEAARRNAERAATRTHEAPRRERGD